MFEEKSWAASALEPQRGGNSNRTKSLLHKKLQGADHTASRWGGAVIGLPDILLLCGVAYSDGKKADAERWAGEIESEMDKGIFVLRIAAGCQPPGVAWADCVKLSIRKILPSIC